MEFLKGNRRVVVNQALQKVSHKTKKLPPGNYITSPCHSAFLKMSFLLPRICDRSLEGKPSTYDFDLGDFVYPP